MSRGLGKTERAVLAYLESHSDAPWSVSTLASVLFETSSRGLRIVRGNIVPDPEGKHRHDVAERTLRQSLRSLERKGRVTRRVLPESYPTYVWQLAAET